MTLKSVHLPSDVYCTCILHTLSVEGEEVMGLLIGKFDDDNNAMIKSTIILQRSDKRKDRVEILPEQLHSAMVKTQELTEKTGDSVNVLGWYHSHPHITVNPSHVDLRTQACYQNMDNRFVGVIFSVFNEDKAKVQKIQVTCFQSLNPGKGEPHEKIEVPLFIDSVNYTLYPCLETQVSLPGTISQEDIQTYKQMQDNNVNCDFFSKLHNDSVCVISQSRILRGCTNPLIVSRENNLMYCKTENEKLRTEIRRLTRNL